MSGYCHTLTCIRWHYDHILLNCFVYIVSCTFSLSHLFTIKLVYHTWSVFTLSCRNMSLSSSASSLLILRCDPWMMHSFFFGRPFLLEADHDGQKRMSSSGFEYLSCSRGFQDIGLVSGQWSTSMAWFQFWSICLSALQHCTSAYATVTQPLMDLPVIIVQ